LLGQKHARAFDTMFVWPRRHPEFAQEYKFAKWFQCQCLADETVDIAVDWANDCNPENFRRAKRQMAAPSIRPCASSFPRIGPAPDRDAALMAGRALR
jgi:hypothetical protein